MTTYYVYLDVKGTGYNIFTDPVDSVTADTKGICIRTAAVDCYRGSVTEACAYIIDVAGGLLFDVTDAAGAKADCAHYVGCFEVEDEGENDGN